MPEFRLDPVCTFVSAHVCMFVCMYLYVIVCVLCVCPHMFGSVEYIQMCVCTVYTYVKCDYVCAIVYLGLFSAHIYKRMCVCALECMCARVTDIARAILEKACVWVCVHVRVFETWGCITSPYAQPLWLTPSPVAPYSGSLPVGTTQPVVEEGRWTEELGSSCQFSFSSWDVFVYYLKNL